MGNMEPIKVANNWWEYIEEHPTFTGCLNNNDNDILWLKNGLLHREDGPAVEKNNGTKKWLINGLLHREDGPAFVWANGRIEWWLNDELYYTEQDYKIALRKMKLERVLKQIEG